MDPAAVPTLVESLQGEALYGVAPVRVRLLCAGFVPQR